MAERDGEEIQHHAPGDLPAVELPPLSPAGASSEAPAEVEAAAAVAAAEVEAPAATEISSNAEDAEKEAAVSAPEAPRAWFQLSRRHQRRVTLAVWLALVAGLGALFGSAISNGLAGHRGLDVASLEQRKAMQQSIDQLTKQVSALKADLAEATAVTHSQIAKISARANRAPGSEITGSVAASGVTLIPIPRPAPRIAAAVSRPAVVRSWHILRARDGLIDVESRSGIYQVVPGAVLPGLGRVQSIGRQDGRWVVVTPKGIIVSSRDRPYFDDF